MQQRMKREESMLDGMLIVRRVSDDVASHLELRLICWRMILLDELFCVCAARNFSDFLIELSRTFE